MIALHVLKAVKTCASLWYVSKVRWNKTPHIGASAVTLEEILEIWVVCCSCQTVMLCAHRLLLTSSSLPNPILALMKTPALHALQAECAWDLFQKSIQGFMAIKLSFIFGKCDDLPNYWDHIIDVKRGTAAYKTSPENIMQAQMNSRSDKTRACMRPTELRQSIYVSLSECQKLVCMPWLCTNACLRTLRLKCCHSIAQQVSHVAAWWQINQ